MGIRAVVFDIGGVLEIAPHTGWDARWCDRLGLSPAEFDRRTGDIWRDGACGEASLEQVHARLAAALGTDSSTVDAMMEEMWASYLGTLNVDLVEYARSLRPRYRTGILSNSFVGAREREQRAYGLTDLVDDVVYSHEVGLGKPDPRVYELTCARVGARAEEIVFLDDVPACVDAAAAFGMHAILFQNNEQAIAEIEARLTV